MSDKKITGRIHSLRAGTYTVVRDEGAGEALQCRACGRFRLEGLTPLVGDLVRAEDLGGGEGFVTEILPRRNALKRPPLANLDQLFLLSSVAQPAPNLRLLDMLIAQAELLGIEPVILFTKCDLAEPGAVEALLENYRAFNCLALLPESDIGPIRALLADRVSGFCGNTGVGKTTLLNRLAPALALPTGEISQKLGRGRHTTRHVELFSAAGGWVADTPGFGVLEPDGQEGLTKDNLFHCFREFAPYAGQCRFADCAHIKDKGCAVLRAVAAGETPQSRWESYAALYEALKNKKDWE
ncbi:MAG: ribosome small subunit-dependent GTPase A [Oscillospiraceae bacterium]|jgi:ribosome biogenesis GTPase|nr:ribosome small subunit-dependent GTPase A [Oscillospiraceae bacterium]